MSQPKTILTREELARAEVGHTAVTGPMKAVLAAGFLAIIFSVPLVQFGLSTHRYLAGRRDTPVPQPFDIFYALPDAGAAFARTEGGPLDRLLAMNRVLLRGIDRYETALEEESCAGAWIRPPAQHVLAAWLGSGNEQAYVGRKGWLFYRPGLDYLTGPAFLDPAYQARRAASGSETVAPPQPDPLKAVLEFREQLAERGIALVVMPTPVKPCVHPERFSPRYEPEAGPIQNPSYGEFVAAIEARGDTGLHVVDVAPELVEAKAEAERPQYLATDTHWRPEAVERVATRLAAAMTEHVELPAVRPPGFVRAPSAEVTNEGDVAALLDLPEGQTAFPPETVRIRQVRHWGGGLWRSDPGADVLVLGDSFSNIYSLEAMGWGESAGLIEQLSLALDRPVDRIVRNDDGAHATRQVLSRELARGRDRLAGKRVVVWQFAVRELSVGDWQLLPMDLGEPPDEQFVVPEPGEQRVVTGTVAAVSFVPRPGAVTYRDHICSVHLVDLEDEKGPIAGGQAVVYLMSMRDSEWTEAARLRPGDRITVRIRPWMDVQEELGGINRSELTDMALRLQEPNWGEPLEAQAGVVGFGTPEGGVGRPWPVFVLAGVLAACLSARAVDKLTRR